MNYLKCSMQIRNRRNVKAITSSLSVHISFGVHEIHNSIESNMRTMSSRDINYF
jgi:hypothetical protein